MDPDPAGEQSEPMACMDPGPAGAAGCRSCSLQALPDADSAGFQVLRAPRGPFCSFAWQVLLPDHVPGGLGPDVALR
jgi:hypothetical protein